MGKVTTRVVEDNGASRRVRELGDEITDVRRRLEVLVIELDRRRHNATDWRRQLRLRGRTIALGVLVVAVSMTAPVAFARALAHRRYTLAARRIELGRKARRLGRAFERIADNPDRLAPAEATLGFGSRIAVAVAAMITQVLARTTVRAMVRPHVR
jgi:hypothetical protein